MMSTSKRAAAAKAVEYVRDGMIVGLGTGSTANFAIEFIGQKVQQGLTMQGVASSLQTERLARENHIPLLSDFEKIDLTIDGADEVDPHGNLIKGGGGALTREKIVAAASAREIIIVDESKCVGVLGAFPLPVEVLPFGWRHTVAMLEAQSCEARLRLQGEAPFVTDNGNYIIDCQFREISSPEELSEKLNAIPGVIENGLFIALTDVVIVGKKDGTTEEFTFSEI